MSREGAVGRGVNGCREDDKGVERGIRKPKEAIRASMGQLGHPGGDKVIERAIRALREKKGS